MQNDGRNILIFGALPILEAAARHNSFTKAALEFGISQSALSRRIQRLELETGIALFARRGRTISLTEDGARLAEAARLALDLVEAARDSATVSTEGTLTLGVLPSLGSRWLAPLLAGFRRAYPGVYVRVETIDADFRSDHKDPVTWDPSVLDIVITRGHGGWRTLDAYKLFDEHMIAVRAAGEHLETRIGHSTRSGAWQAYLDKAKISIAMDRPGLVFEHYYMVLEAVRSGAGIGLVPLATVKQDLQDGTLVAFGPQIATGASYYAVTAPRNTTRAAPAAFIEWLKDIPTDQ